MIPDAWRRHGVSVVGIGRSGSAAARWLRRRDVPVYASDHGNGEAQQAAAQILREAGASVDTGTHDLERIAQSAAVIVSPGVPPKSPPLQAARNAGTEVLSEVELALREMPHTQFIAVTGTNGKTTTTALIAHMLVTAGFDAVAAGNIGQPVTDVADRDPPLPWCVLELSSFQLHDTPSVQPRVGVLTNLAPDHQNRYESVDEYFEDKRQLFRNATADSVWVLNADDSHVSDLAASVPGTRRRFSVVEQADAWYDTRAHRLMLGTSPLLEREELPLLGDHNVANALAAILAAHAVGADADDIGRGLTSFAPVPHRLEPVGTTGGVRWINDSKSTNVASAAAALRSMTAPFLWIAGGQDKGEDFAPLDDHLEQCRAVIVFGEAGNRIGATFVGRNVVFASTLAEAVEAARDIAVAGDVGLFAPACASFDQFDNFEHRGETFRDLVSA